ncbi:MAG: hypothetical protein JSV03_15320, partial [Planctomycetota bacterium]
MPPLVNQRISKYNWFALSLVMFSGCQWFVDDADHEVYRLLDQRQQQAVGAKSDVKIADKDTISTDLAGPKSGDDAYSFIPHPIDAEVPDSFQKTSTQPASAATQPELATTQPTSAPANNKILTLAEALEYAFKHSRDFQNAKEDLYLAALELTLERHLWTPRLFGEIESEYANYGQIRDFDHAMSAVAEVGIEQNLPYGGQITARVVNTLMRDLTNHITSAETGAMILEADIPLLRGAGRAAYESRYQ